LALKTNNIPGILMTLHELIEKYKLQVKICFDIKQYDEATSAVNNKAVEMMYEIVEQINHRFGLEGMNEFARLLDSTENDINLWVAPQLLERMKPDEKIKTKALKIIRDAAAGDDTNESGFQTWLRNWEKKNA
jgi:hypothetical protein